MDRPIIKRDRRSFVDAPNAAGIPYPEVAELAEDESFAANNPLALTFHYQVPAHLAGQIQPGQLVAVPFRTEQLPAVVVSLSETSPVNQTKPIAAILDPEPVLTPMQIGLAHWLSYQTLAPLALCVRYFLPPGSARKSEFVLKPASVIPKIVPDLNAPEQILLNYLRQHGSVPLTEVEPGVAESLLAKGLVRREATLTKPRVGPKVDRTVELLIAPDEVEAILPTLGRSSKQAEVLLHLADLDDPLPALTDVLAQVDCTRGPVEALAQKGWVEIIPKQTRLAIPPTSRSADLSPHSTSMEADLSEAETKVINYLLEQKQPSEIEAVLTTTGASRATLNSLIKKEAIARFDEPERVTLTLPASQFTEAIIELRGVKKQAEVLRLLAEEDGPVWVGWVYAQTEANLSTLKELALANLVS
ncbi:MAG: hypothetical protein HYR94_16445, partial [Chloroflexi bacterium]|nr:hypothetical protein [Chloroflexota bacterium]